MVHRYDQERDVRGALGSMSHHELQMKVAEVLHRRRVGGAARSVKEHVRRVLSVARAAQVDGAGENRFARRERLQEEAKVRRERHRQRCHAIKEAVERIHEKISLPLTLCQEEYLFGLVDGNMVNPQHPPLCDHSEEHGAYLDGYIDGRSGERVFSPRWFNGKFERAEIFV